MSRSFLGAAGAAITLFLSGAWAQQPPPAPAAGAPPAGGRGGGFSQPAPSDWNDHEGWKQIFDGQSLANWNCDPNFWSVADGAITAKSTAEKPTGTTYCSWMGGEPADFELKLEFRMLTGGNSGVQYRSVPQPARGGGAGGGGGFGGGRGAGAPAAGGAAAAAPVAPPPPTSALPTVQPCQMQIPVMMPVAAGRGGGGRGGAGGGAGAARGGAGGAAPGGGGGARGPNPYDVGGYQYDFDFTGMYPGNLYENGMAANAPAGTSNRGIITYKGQVVHLLPDAKRETIGCTADAGDLRGVMNINGWNYIHVVARGPVLLHLLNGRLITATIDDDPVRRKASGRIAVQIEGLGEVFFRNIWLRNW